MSTLLFMLVALCLSLSFHGTEGGRKTFNRLQRSTIEPKGDEEFDCVDMHKQPAFDHVLLKDHKIQMSPSSWPKFKKSSKNSKFVAPTKGCPPGMVPIHRTPVNYNETELRAFAKLHLGQNIKTQSLAAAKSEEHFAAMYKEGDESIFGAGAEISLYKPAVQSNQVSMSQIWIESGPPQQLNSIQVGWAVHPGLYGDTNVRVTAYWTIDGSQKTGCYNTMCPGFVQVDSTFHLGQIYPNVSTPDGPQFSTRPRIYQDDQGNWWVTFDDGIKVGYWPREVFPGFTQDGVNFLQFGGWTSSAPDGVSPPMGSGLLPDKNYQRSSYFSQIQTMDEHNEFIDVEGLQSFTDNATCYDVKYWGNDGGALAETFTFGGPGGLCSA